MSLRVCGEAALLRVFLSVCFSCPPPSVGGVGSRQQKQRLRAPRQRSRPPSRGGCRRMLDFDLKRPTYIIVATHRHTDSYRGLLEMTPLCMRICPYPLFEATPPGAAPDPRLKPGPVFVASGDVTSVPSNLKPQTLLHPRKTRSTERGLEAGVRGASPGVWVRRTGGGACARIHRGVYPL